MICAGRLGAAEPIRLAQAGAPLAVSPTAWSDHGFEYRASLSVLSLSNASPLAYDPLEIGWRFSNGVRVRSGLDLFYYNAQEADPTQAGSFVGYTYSMQDWRTTVAYEVPLPFAIHPVVGVSLEFLWGSRLLQQVPLNTPNNTQAAWGGFGPGGVLGLQWRGGAHWALSSLARYTLPFGAPGPIAALDFGVHYLY